jgi:hypothetical protein
MQILGNINDAMLDKVYQLQKKRERLIEDTGDFYSVGFSSIRLKALREGNTLFFQSNSPVLPGHIIKHRDLLGCLIAKSVHEEAGRLRVETEFLDGVTSVHTKVIKGVDPLGREHYRVSATGWSSIPFSYSGKQARLPKAFTPDKGDLLLIGGEYFEVKALKFDSDAVVVCTLESF